MQQASAALSCSASWLSRYLIALRYITLRTCLKLPAAANHCMYHVDQSAICFRQFV